MSDKQPQQCRELLKNLLTRQTDELGELNGYLDEIKNAIIEGNTESLNALVTQQRLPIAEIDDLENQRNRLLEIYGFKSGLDGLEQCIAWCDNDEIIAKQYELFRDALQHLQRAIQINSLMINKGQQRVRQGLHLLTGQQGVENARTYSSDGKTRDNSNRRHLAQA